MASGREWNLWVWLAGGGCGWNLWVWLVGVVVRRYIDYLILLIPTPFVSALFAAAYIPTFCKKKLMFFVLYIYKLTNFKSAYRGAKSSSLACSYQASGAKVKLRTILTKCVPDLTVTYLPTIQGFPGLSRDLGSDPGIQGFLQ